MKGKTVITVILLAFVAVSLAYLVLDESTGNSAGQEAPSPGTAAGPADQTTADSGEVEQPGMPQEEIASEDAVALADANADAPAHKVIAYYFHNTQRCMTCNKIERLAREALQEKFATALEAGDLEWRVVNMEEAPNTHFVEDYQLVTSSLVLVDVHAGQQRDWTNMEKVWQYVHDDEAAFKRYVADQAREYLES
jgi:hypothetical protein